MSGSIPADWPKTLLALINRKDQCAAGHLIASLRACSDFDQHSRLLSLEAWLFLDQGLVDQAINAILEARRLEPSSIAYAHRHGEILMAEGRWAEAETAYGEAVSLSLADKDTYFLDDSRARLVFCLLKQEKKAAARQIVDKVSETFESEIDGRLYRKFDLISKCE